MISTWSSLDGNIAIKELHKIMSKQKKILLGRG